MPKITMPNGAVYEGTMAECQAWNNAIPMPEKRKPGRPAKASVPAPTATPTKQAQPAKRLSDMLPESLKAKTEPSSWTDQKTGELKTRAKVIGQGFKKGEGDKENMLYYVFPGFKEHYFGATNPTSRALLRGSFLKAIEHLDAADKLGGFAS